MFFITYFCLSLYLIDFIIIEIIFNINNRLIFFINGGAKSNKKINITKGISFCIFFVVNKLITYFFSLKIILNGKIILCFMHIKIICKYLGCFFIYLLEYQFGNLVSHLFINFFISRV